MIEVTDGVSYWDRQARALGEKIAADQVVAYNLSGRLYVSTRGGEPWGLLSVPNAMVQGVFSAMAEPGVELPLNDAGRLNAHVSVFRPEEIEMLGGPDALLNDRGKVFRYTIGRLVSVEPDGWADVARCWMIRVHSPELQALRRSYGLSGLPKGGEYDFHVTVGVRRRGVLGRGTTSKDTTAA